MQVAIKFDDQKTLRKFIKNYNYIGITKEEIFYFKEEDFPVYVVEISNFWRITSHDREVLTAMGYCIVSLDKSTTPTCG